MFPARKAIDYIDNKQEFQQFRCSLCYNLSLQIFQCEGACQKYFCISCIDRFASNRYACNYCSDGITFRWKTVQFKNVEFVCPYTLTKHKQIRTIEQFEAHCFNCQEMKEQNLLIAEYIQNYQCKNGHTLIFLSESIARKIFTNNFFQALTHSQCQTCKQITLCRSYCPTCSKDNTKQIFYCTKCRRVPATKKCCPIGHNLIQKRYRSQSSLCDFCGFGDRFSRKFAFNDGTCNLDVCYRCYSKLPNQNKLQPLKNEFELPKKEPAKVDIKPIYGVSPEQDNLIEFQ